MTENLVQVKFLIVPEETTEEPQASEHFFVEFPVWDLPKKDDYIVKDTPGDDVIMYRVLDKTYCIDQGKVLLSYYSVVLE